MKFLILGDLVGSSGRKALNKYLKEIIEVHRINFTVLNGENSADDGHGIPCLLYTSPSPRDNR